MIKRSLMFGFTFFLCSLLFYLFRGEPDLYMIAGVSVLAFLFDLMWEWAKVPYQWGEKGD